MVPITLTRYVRRTRWKTALAGLMAAFAVAGWVTAASSAEPPGQPVVPVPIPAVPPQASSPILTCGLHNELIPRVMQEYGPLRHVALGQEGELVEVFVGGGEYRTWAVVITGQEQPHISCVRGTGTDWTDFWGQMVSTPGPGPMAGG